MQLTGAPPNERQAPNRPRGFGLISIWLQSLIGKRCVQVGLLDLNTSKYDPGPSKGSGRDLHTAAPVNTHPSFHSCRNDDADSS